MKLCLHLACGLVLVTLMACNRGPVPCRNSAECAPTELCLAGFCAPKCTSDSQCLPTERCSSAGGCVLKGACVVDADCPSGQSCGPDGHCSSADAGPVSCGGELFKSTKVQANFLIVLDRSASMEEMAGNSSKWWAASQAVQSVTSQNDQAIRFGLALYPGISGTARCQTGSVVVPVGDSKAAAVKAMLPADAVGNSTPIATALQVAAAAPELTDATRANFVLLVTDGQENCGGNPTIPVQQMFSRGIKTYVVGFGSAVNAAGLAQLATVGGTARVGGVKYYQADDPATLNAAMGAIAAGAMGCDFALAKVPPDTSKLYVYVNGQLAAHDPARTNGWEYTPATNRLTLYGPTCDAVSTPTGRVSIIYGCPDVTFIEGGGSGSPFDGGSPGPSDGGIDPGPN
ncbi:MAG: vWA domain-containing protein [Myxococcaceae bacterium]